MSVLAYLRSIAAKFLRGSRVEQDMDDELRFHVQQRADDLQRSGLTRNEAERRARMELGARLRVKEDCRAEMGGNFLDVLLQDTRYAIRVLRKSPGFAAIAVLTLALAIGSNAVVFGVLNALILRPLDVPDGASLYGIEQGKNHSMAVSYPDYRDLRDRNRSFDGLAAAAIEAVGVDTGDYPTRVWAKLVSGNYFEALRIQPYLGRMLQSADERGPNSAPYVVLGYDFWRSRFQQDRNIVGRVIRVNKRPLTVVGVAPPSFHGTLVFFSPALYIPLVNQEQIQGRSTLESRAVRWIFMSFGHLKPGITPEQAVVDLNSVGAYLERTHPKEHGNTTYKVVRPGLYGNYLGKPLKAFVSGLLALAALILLAACANLGNLFASRAADRSREVALRLALGASRSRIVRQLLTEAVLIAIAGGAVGSWGSIVLLRAMTNWHPLPKLPINIPVSPDASVYITALLLALVSGVLFGVVPVRQVLRVDPYQVVKAGPSGTSGRKMQLRDLLLVVQIAICAVLVTSSIVAGRGLSRSLHDKFGFNPQNAYLADTDLNMSGYTGDQVQAMQKRTVEALQAIPGVTAAAMASPLPLAEGTTTTAIFSDDTADLRASNAMLTAIRYVVSPDYFKTAETAMLAGREFSWHDDDKAPRVAVVNGEFARKIFGSTENALGRQFKLRTGARLQIVGLVEDGKYGNLAEDPQPAFFMPMLQAGVTESWFIVRSNRDPETVAAAIRGTVRGLDPSLPLYLQRWNQQLTFALFPSRMAALSLGVMGVMGAVLALTGIFGMAAYSVSKRLKELGIRIALGAQRRQVLAAALGRALKLLAWGSAAGVALGVLASRVLAVIVYQATPRDPVVLGGVVIVMLCLGLLATWIPAQRALSVDPLTLLREE